MATRDPNRREKIIEVARRIFARHGYDGASISMIATEAGLTKAALYHHFKNKEAIYRVSSRTGMDELVTKVDNALKTVGKHPVERLRAYMRASADRFDKNQDSWVSGSAIFWSTHSPATRSEVLQLRDQYEGVLKQILRDGIQEGIFRSDLDPNLASKFLLSVVNQLPRWYRKGGRYTAVEIIDIYLDTYLDGILSEQAVTRNPEPCQP
jgi:Transcriptional regulator